MKNLQLAVSLCLHIKSADVFLQVHAVEEKGRDRLTPMPIIENNWPFDPKY